MNIHITLVTYALDITPMVRAMHDDNIHWHIFTHHERMHDVVCGLQDTYPNIHDYLYGTNRGLAKSWNEGLMASQDMGADVLMLANDDIVATRGDVEVLATAALENRNHYFVSGMGYDQSTGERKQMLLALAAINPIAIETIGYFDERFCPIYFEDLDYYRRAELAGLQPLFIDGTNIVHVGSATRKVENDEAQFWIDFERNRQLYVSKWGGDGNRGTETYTTPFNSGEALA